MDRVVRRLTGHIAAPVTVAASVAAIPAVAVTVAAAITVGVTVAATTAVCARRRWWFGRAAAVRRGGVRQRSFVRLRGSRQMARTSGRHCRSELYCVSGFGCEFSRFCTG